MISPAEFRTIAEYVAHGDYNEAATCSGVGYWTIKRQLASAYAKTESRGAIELLKTLGWLRVPDEHRHQA